VIACDGIWDVATDQVAIDVVEKAGKDALAKASKLIGYSIEKGTTDNLTAMVVLL
jgi:protein phosphatase PTC1